MNTILNKIINDDSIDKQKILSDIFKNNLKSLRQESQKTQKQMADKLHIAVSTYANWEQGRREPSIADIYTLLCILDISANELFEIPITKYI